MAQTKEGAIKVAARKAGLSVDEYIARVTAGSKRCTTCKEWKRRDQFGKDSHRSDGTDAHCFTCRRVKIRICTKGRPSTFKGKHHTEETKNFLSELRKGKPFPQRLGKKHSAETRAKMSEIKRKTAICGDRHYAWKDGSSQRNLNARRTTQYQDWRNAVFKRDAYTCQKCRDDKGGNLRAHHIKPFAEFPELRFEVSNGQTLCHNCHEAEHFKPGSIRNVRKLKRGERLWQ